jgi:hypothetical protein
MQSGLKNLPRLPRAFRTSSTTSRVAEGLLTKIPERTAFGVVWSQGGINDKWQATSSQMFGRMECTRRR